jgi:hypothetical protein
MGGEFVEIVKGMLRSSEKILGLWDRHRWRLKTDFKRKYRTAGLYNIPHECLL